MRFRKLMLVLFSILMLSLVFWFATRNWDQVRQIRLVNPQLLWLLAALLLSRITLRGYFHWQVMRSLGVDIPLRKVLALNYSGTMMNQLLPMPVGPGYRAAYLKKNYDFPFSLFASTLAALFVYFLLVSTTLGLAAGLWFYFNEEIVEWEILALLVIVLTFCISMIALPRFVRTDGQESTGWFRSRAVRILSGWKTIVGSTRLILGASAVVAVSTVVGAISMVLVFKVIGISIGLAGALLLMSSQRIGALFKLTPGALGFQEIIGVYFSTILDQTAVETAVVLLVHRCIHVSVAVAIGLPALWSLEKSESPIGKPNTDNETVAEDE